MQRWILAPKFEVRLRWIRSEITLILRPSLSANNNSQRDICIKLFFRLDANFTHRNSNAAYSYRLPTRFSILVHFETRLIEVQPGMQYSGSNHKYRSLIYVVLLLPRTLVYAIKTYFLEQNVLLLSENVKTSVWLNVRYKNWCSYIRLQKT